MERKKTKEKKPARKAAPKRRVIPASKKVAAVKRKSVVKARSSKKIVEHKSSQKTQGGVSFFRVIVLLVIVMFTVIIFVKAFAKRLEAPQEPMVKKYDRVLRQENPEPAKIIDAGEGFQIYRNEKMGIQFKYPEKKIMINDGDAVAQADAPVMNIGTGVIYQNIPNQLFPSANLSEFMKNWDAQDVSKIDGVVQWTCAAVTDDKKGKRCYSQKDKNVYEFDYFQGDNDLFTEEEFNAILESVDFIDQTTA